MNIKIKLKYCPGCKKNLPLDNFYKCKNRKSGLDCHCKTCQKTYRKFNLKYKKYKIKYRKEHKKEADEYSENYRKKFKSKIHKSQKLYRTTVNGIYTTLKCRIRKTKIKFNISKKDFLDWYDKQEKKCHYCERSIDEIKLNKRELNRFKMRLSIDRVDNSVGYILKNMVLACYRCNSMKSDYFTEKEMLKIGNFIRNNII